MSVKITVAKRNGLEEIHKPGCKDLKNRSRRGVGSSDRDDWTLEVDTLRDLYASYWDCIADEQVGEGQYETLEQVWWAWRGEFRLMPCAGPIAEMDDPGVEIPCPYVPKDGRMCIGLKGHKGRHVLRAKPAPEPEPARRERGHRQYATKAVSGTMTAYAEWIAREFPELGELSERDTRLILIASKAYRSFQASDLNPEK